MTRRALAAMLALCGCNRMPALDEATARRLIEPTVTLRDCDYRVGLAQSESCYCTRFGTGPNDLCRELAMLTGAGKLTARCAGTYMDLDVTEAGRTMFDVVEPARPPSSPTEAGNPPYARVVIGQQRFDRAYVRSQREDTFRVDWSLTCDLNARGRAFVALGYRQQGGWYFAPSGEAKIRWVDGTFKLAPPDPPRDHMSHPIAF
jgi:hypothetical protein